MQVTSFVKMCYWRIFTSAIRIHKNNFGKRSSLALLHFKLLPLLLINTFAFFNLTASIPDCSNTSEIEKFLLSDEFQAVYSFYAAVKMRKITLNSNRNATDQFTFSVNINDILPKNKSLYLRRHPPALCDRSEPTRINFHLHVTSLDSVDEISMTYTSDVWFAVAWFDHRLRYPENTIDDFCLLDPQWVDYLWIPDVIFKNARQITFHKLMVPNHFLILLRNMAIVYVSKLTLTLTCPMNLQSYPHDVQVCDMEMESMTYTTRRLLFSWDTKEGISVKNVETPRFALVHFEVKDCTNFYLSGSFPCVRALFYLKRRIGYHLIHTFLPSALIVMLSWIQFWIKPEEIATRFAFGLTVLLTLATLNKQTQESLPEVSYSKAVDIWMMTCSLFIIVSIIEFAVLNYLIGTDSLISIEDSKKPSRNELRSRRIRHTSHCADKCSRILFPGAFFLFNLWYWNAYTS